MKTKKAPAIRTTISDPLIHRQLTCAIENTILKITRLCFVDTNGKNVGRSSTKTDALHRGIAEALNISLGDYQEKFNDEFEVKIETEGKNGKTKRIVIHDYKRNSFNVDLIIKDKAGSKLVNVFLVKAPLSSINKNAKNNETTTMGEINRVLGNDANPDAILTFINIIPDLHFHASEGKLTWSQTAEHAKDEDVQISGFIPSIKSRVKIVNIHYNWKFLDPAFNDGTLIPNKSIKTLAHFNEVVAYNVRKGYNFVAIEDRGISDFSKSIIAFLEQHSDNVQVKEILETISHNAALTMHSEAALV